MIKKLRIEDIIIEGPRSKKGVNKVKMMENGINPCFTSGNNIYLINDFLVDGKYIFMNDGGSADVKFNEGKSYYTDHVYSFTTIDNINPKYLYYYLKNNEHLIEQVYFQGVGLKNLNKSILLFTQLHFNLHDYNYNLLKINSPIQTSVRFLIRKLIDCPYMYL